MIREIFGGRGKTERDCAYMYVYLCRCRVGSVVFDIGGDTPPFFRCVEGRVA
jgi:hypothetical protein